MEKEREYSEDGIDLTLIRWMLSLTPPERLQVLQQHVNSVLRLRAALNSRDHANINRLMAALDERHAIYRMAPESKLKHGPSHFVSRGHQLLMTTFGPSTFSAR